jgi:hypothetical protein
MPNGLGTPEAMDRQMKEGTRRVSVRTTLSKNLMLRPLWIAVLLLLSCSAQDDRSASIADADLAASAPPPARHASASSLRAAYVAALQAGGAEDPQYHFAPSTPGDLSASNPLHGFQLTFSEGGARLGQSAEALPLTLETTSVGCAEGAFQLQPVLPSTAGPNEVRYEHSLAGARVTEWYLNGPAGLEQGWTLERQPCEGPIVSIDVAVGGRTLVPSEDGQSVSLHGDPGSVVITYGELFAADADGRELDASLRVEGAHIRIQVDISEATFPVRIDPLVALETQKLLAPAPYLGAAGDQFGWSVAISDQTAIVGAFRDNLDSIVNAGSAYIFVRSGSTWQLQAWLTAPDAAADAGFGWSVALDGDTAIVGANPGIGTPETMPPGSAYVFVRSGTSWSMQQKITPADGGTGDQFGSALDLSGETAVIGGNESAYVYVRSGSTWSLEQKVPLGGLVSSIGADADTFIANAGTTAFVYTRSGATWTQQTTFASALYERVALDTDTALVGSKWAGSVRVFTRSGATWTQQQILTPNDAAPNNLFGNALAISGDLAFIGAEGSNVDGFDYAGAAYVFVRTGSVWTQQRKITATVPGAIAYFGGSVGLDGTTAIAGASRHLVNGISIGSAFVYVQGGGDWPLQQQVLATRGRPGDEFGSWVDVDGTTAAVSGKHAASGLQIFTRQAGDWVLQQELPGVAGRFALSGDRLVHASGTVYERSGTTWAPLTTLGHSGSNVAFDGVTIVLGEQSQALAHVYRWNGSSFIHEGSVDHEDFSFGFGVAVHGDRFAVGAPYADEVVVYARSGSGTWTQDGTVNGSGFFGDSVAMDGDRLVVGAYIATVGGFSLRGAAHVFRRDPGGWVPEQTLSTNAPASSQFFGQRVAIEGNTIVCGASPPFSLSSTIPGSFYVFTLGAGGWTWEAKVSASDGSVDDRFGFALALSGATVFTGAPSADFGPHTNQGAAYSHMLSGLFGHACISTADCASPYFCVDSVCCASTCEGPCQACSAALGATADGICTTFPAGSAGSPACAGGVLCDGVSGSCPSGCADDSMCDAGKYCTAGGTCAETKALGAACNPSTDCKLPASCSLCATGYCVDGYCCDAACSGSCETCSAAAGAPANGTCGPRPAGTTGTPPCAGSVLCDGASGECPDGCSQDNECPGGTYCDGSACQSKKAQGSSCARPGECATNLCVDAVCCDQACTNPCDACSAAAKQSGMDDGLCGPALAGSNPGNRCTQDVANVCGQTGVCNAFGTCALAASGTSCGADACVGNMVKGKICDGTGVCTDEPTGTDCAPYVCAAGACVSPCGSDTDCVSTHYCDAGTCTQKGALGVSCAAGRECATGNCATGVCCDRVCTNPCEACSAEAKQSGLDPGLCGPAKEGTDPGNRCAVDTGNVCGQTGVCNAFGTCQLAPSGTSCGPTSCAGSDVKGLICDGTGACVDEPTGVACAPYQCSGGACTSPCQGDAHCVATHFCLNGTCVARSADGLGCTEGRECTSGNCVDGVCCDSACNNPCEACAASTKESGQNSGVCGPAAAGTDPGNRCATDTANVCGQTGVCSPFGHCAVAPSGTSCGPTLCIGNDVKGQICDGTGACVDEPTGVPCSPYLCVNSACTSPCASDLECIPGYRCEGELCVAQAEPGRACTASRECASGFCVDGVCCDAPCTGQCEACTESGSVGTCRPVAGNPRGARAACSGEGPCTGRCDGGDPTACRFPDRATECAPSSCSGDVLQPAGTCDGAGACRIPETTGCAPYGCTAGTCNAACAVNSDCASGAVCVAASQTCTQAGTMCKDAFTVISPGGAETSCSPYTCAAGSCREVCSSDSDCADGHVCSGAACVQPGSSVGGGDGGDGVFSTDTQDAGGCNCRMSGPSSPARGTMALLMLLPAAAVRRRWRRVGAIGGAA